MNFFNPFLLSEDEKSILTNKISQRSHQSEGNNGCITWNLSVNSSGYPQMKLGQHFDKFFKNKPYSPAHILFSIQNNIILNAPFHELSHLCHNKLCLNIEHLSYEPSVINTQRNVCKDRNSCHQNHGVYHNCIM